MKLTTNQINMIIGIVAFMVLGEVAVSFREAGISGTSIRAFFDGLGTSELMAGTGLSITGAGGYFAGKMRENHLIRKISEAPKVD